MSVATEADRLEILRRDAPLPMIAARIKRARKAAGFSHDTLGARMGGVTRQHLIKLEKGQHRPSLDTISRIADATGKRVEYFLVEEAGEPNPFPDGEDA